MSQKVYYVSHRLRFLSKRYDARIPSSSSHPEFPDRAKADCFRISNDNGNYLDNMYRLQVAPWSIVHNHASGIVFIVFRERSSWDEISDSE